MSKKLDEIKVYFNSQMIPARDFDIAEKVILQLQNSLRELETVVNAKKDLCTTGLHRRAEAGTRRSVQPYQPKREFTQHKFGNHRRRVQ